MHSLVGMVIVLRGGFRWFQRLMTVCIGLMFVAVIVTAILSQPDLGAILAGLAVPSTPPIPSSSSTAYTLGVLGGVGGTVTLLSYGYWIRERGRSGHTGVRESRLDLASGYLMTALFGIAMIVIGSRVSLRQGPTAALELAGQLGTVLGPGGKWVFLVGFWAAVFSSLLGVWQSVPYLFADLVKAGRSGAAGQMSSSRRSAAEPLGGPTTAYRGFLLYIGIVPLVLLGVTMERAQLLYAVFGALFMPLLALALLVMNTRTAWVGREFRNGWLTNIVLVATFLLFAWIGGREIVSRVGALLVA
jgi:Mn2+/Fe2+ NRAMP family transporter